MNIHVGTSGWSYKEWKGAFYPPKLSAREMLRFYSSRFSAVEVNNSFYRIPSERVLATWADQVPAGFQFVMKASRRITHNQRLRDDGSLAYFCRAVNPLGSRLGPTLFQLPPIFTRDVACLESFLARLPRQWRAAFEFRDQSWFVDEVYQLLRARNAALVAVDEEESQGRGAPLVPTADWGYARLRRGAYGASALRDWAARVRDQPWHEAYLFLKHEEGSPTGPGAALELGESVGAAQFRDQDHDSA
jgi:uncharacterized protein YecE (DUF72 family)